MWKRLLTLWLPRLCVWSVLIALGFLLWHLVQPQPRCRIPGPGSFSSPPDYHLSHDGRLLIVGSSGSRQTTLQVWDTFSGQIHWELPWDRKKVGSKRWGVAVSRNDRFIVRNIGNQFLTLDLASGREYPLLVEKTDDWDFSCVGRDLFALKTNKKTFIGEFATGRILKTYAPNSVVS